MSYYNDASTAIVHIGQDIQIKVINNTGSSIPNGSPVYVTGTSSGQTYPNVALAKADVAGTSAVIGLTNGAIANGAIGYVTASGGIDNVNTGTFTVGQVLYLSPFSAGQLQNTIPATGLIVQVGLVTYVNSSTGKIYVKQTQPLNLATTQGGTGLTSYTAGDMIYYASGTAFTKLAIGTNGYVITSSGTAPQYTAPSSLSVGTATNIAGGAAGSVPYNTAAATTSFLSIGTANQVLTVNSGATAPQYVNQSTLSVGTATNVAGGAAGSVVYNTGAGATSFLAIGTANQVLTVNTGATAPQYVSQSTLSVGTATNIAGGVAGSVPYNTGAGATSFLSIGTAGQVLTVNSGATAPQYTAQSSLSVGTATNVAGGVANQIHYQTGAGATSFITAPSVASTFLQWNGSAFVWATPSGTTANALTIGTGLSGTSFNGSAAVTIAIDSTVATLTDAQTLTNKRINPRVYTAATILTSYTPDISTYDNYEWTALNQTFTMNAPTGTPVNGNKIIFRLLDNGTSRGITWNATYVAIGVTLPTTTTVNKTTYVGCIYNAYGASGTGRWDVVAVATQA